MRKHTIINYLSITDFEVDCTVIPKNNNTIVDGNFYWDFNEKNIKDVNIVLHPFDPNTDSIKILLTKKHYNKQNKELESEALRNKINLLTKRLVELEKLNIASDVKIQKLEKLVSGLYSPLIRRKEIYDAFSKTKVIKNPYTITPIKEKSPTQLKIEQEKLSKRAAKQALKEALKAKKEREKLIRQEARKKIDKFMDESLIRSLTPEILENFKKLVETGSMLKSDVPKKYQFIFNDEK